jgi:hypothetical protein
MLRRILSNTRKIKKEQGLRLSRKPKTTVKIGRE